MGLSLEQRKELEQRAERALRRGEVTDAVRLLSALVEAFPAEAALKRKLIQVHEMLQPNELLSPKANLTPLPAAPPASPVDAAERLVERGDFAGALTIYRQLVSEHPEAELYRERLQELFTLAQARASHPAKAPKAPASKADVLSGLLERLESRGRRS